MVAQTSALDFSARRLLRSKSSRASAKLATGVRLSDSPVDGTSSKLFGSQPNGLRTKTSRGNLIYVNLAGKDVVDIPLVVDHHLGI